MKPVAVFLLTLSLCAPALAQAPDRSPLPSPRPATTDRAATPPGAADAPRTAQVVIRAGAHAPRQSLRPMQRPGGSPAPARAAAQVAARSAAADAPVATGETVQVIERSGLFGLGRRTVEVRTIAGATRLAVVRSLRPQIRPDGLERQVRAVAARTTPSRVAQPGRRGSLCGRPGIVGETLSPITGRIQGCGIAEPVRVREIDGVTLNQPATINCDAARALQEWLNEGAIPAVGRTGGGIASLRVVASYSCRTRNSRPGARLSEHSTGNAIDIAAIGLVNGQELSVLTDWRRGSTGRLMQRLHRAACGPFGTVLGPNSDRFHQDHFHFDVAGYRSGPYCR